MGKEWVINIFLAIEVYNNLLYYLLMRMRIYKVFIVVVLKDEGIFCEIYDMRVVVFCFL